MKNNQETLLLLLKQNMLAEHVHSVAWPLKIDESLLAELIDDDARSKAIQKIKDRLFIERKSVKPENLIQELAALTWSHNFLEHVAGAMATKIERDRESTLKLLDREIGFESIKISNRKKGAATSNKIFKSALKEHAKERWLGIRNSTGKACGAIKLQKELDKSWKGHNIGIHTLNGWIKQWKMVST